MKTLSIFFKAKACVLVIIIVSAMNVSAQVSITADISWPCWSSENIFWIYAPDGTYLGGACNPSQCYYNGSNISYSTTVTINNAAPYQCGNYRIRMQDSYGDGWNCSGNITVKVNGQSVGNWGLGGSASDVYFSLPTNVYEVAAETNPQHNAPSGCGNGSVKVGSGAYTSISISSNTWYDLSWNLSPSNVNQGRIVSNGSGGTVTGNQNAWYSGTSTSMSVQARRSSCSWTSSSAILTYKRSTPVAGNISVNPTSSCEGGTATFTSSGSSLGNFDMFQYRWNGSGGFNDWGTSNPYNWSTHNTSGTYLQVRARISNDGCYSYTGNVDHTVYDLPATANNTTSTTAICETQTKSLSASPTGGSWSVVSGGGSISGLIYTPANVSSNTSVRIRYTVPSNGPCSGSTDDVVFTVNANPATANNTTSTGAICETQTKSLTASPSGGSWSVVSGGGSISGSTYTPANVSSNTSVRIRYTVPSNGSCSGSSDDVVFTVNANPATANNTTSTAAICETQTKSLTANPSGGSWSVISGGGSISGSTYTPANVSSNTSVRIRYTISGNGACSGSSDDVVFTVNANPATANNTTSTAAICETQTKSLTASPSGGSWSVVSGGGSISGSTYTPANVSSNTSVTVRYTVSGNGACSGSTDDVTFTVNSNPATANNTTDNTTLCEGVDRQLTGSPSGGAWSLIAGSGSISGSSYSTGSLSADETVTVRYTVSGNGSCSGSSDDVSFTANSDNNSTSTWTGAVNSDWHNPENWSNCLPGKNTDVFIPAGPSNQPVIYANGVNMSNGLGECNTIEVQSGASITVKSNSIFKVNE